MGWVAAGGPPFSGELLYISFFFFMWQVPHFWLFVLRYGKEYEEAGLPSLSVVFNRNQLTRIVFAWTNALAVSAILISAAGILKNPAAKFSLFLASLWLIWNSAALLMRRDREAGYAAAFHRINLYMLVAMVAMSADRFMGLSSLL
jgi:protoheme IX farnesyltransferase